MNTNSYYQLAMTIEELKKQCKTVTVTKLPSTINRPRKNYL